MEIQSAATVQKLTAAFIEKGFAFSYFHEKGGDSSCVYIYRFQKGKHFFDWRETSGTNELHFVVYANGQYAFPSLEKRNAKLFRAFKVKHIFKKPTMDEKREIFAAALNAELRISTDTFFGIPL